jgi:3-methyl-2-oxobutanoate hydroxymethyltransferase
MNPQKAPKPVTVATFRQKKRRGERICMLTGYDHFAAQVLDECGIDAILVGDTLGMTVLGYETTLPVTMEDMLHHTRAVARGARTPLVISDMPFGSYQISVEDGVRNAVRFVKEGGAGAVKLEGGMEVIETVRGIVRAGIPVMAHIGFRPQEILAQGGFRIIGKNEPTARQVIAEAEAMVEAGAFALVLECIPSELSAEITARVPIPTIGIGAGTDCDGQILVWHDMLGMFPRFKPTFVKRYAELHGLIRDAVQRYIAEVRSGQFPDDEHSYHRVPIEQAPPDD